MKIRNVEELQDTIDKDFAWRKKELIDIKLLIHSTNNLTMCRVGLAMLCAHFEGFIKQVANYYVLYVASQSIKISSLHTNFAAIQTFVMLKQCTETKKISVYQGYLDKFLDKYSNQNFKVKYTPDNPIIKTNSNPSSEVIEEILDSIGLDFTPYETKRKYIDTDLLSTRHSIVHGEKLCITVGDFDETFKHITKIMRMVADQVIDAAINKEYLASSKNAGVLSPEISPETP